MIAMTSGTMIAMTSGMTWQKVCDGIDCSASSEIDEATRMIMKIVAAAGGAFKIDRDELPMF